MDRAVIRALALTIALLAPVCAEAGSVAMMAGGGVPTTDAPSYLLSEDWDGSTLCATSYGSTCDGTWTVATGVPDFAYATTPAPLEGTSSLRLDACTPGADVNIWKGFTPTAGQKQEAYFMVHVDTLTITSSRVLAELKVNTGAAAVFSIRTGPVAFLVTPAGGTAVSTVSTITTDTTYHVWVTYLKGTGANAVATIAFSTDGTRPTEGNNYAESTNGTGTSDANRLYLWADYSASNCVDAFIDKVRVDDAVIGSNPL